MSYQEVVEAKPERRKQRRYIGSVSLAERYDRSHRAIQRWIAVPPPGFPKPVKHHGRWLWDTDELDAYDDAIRAGAGR